MTCINCQKWYDRELNQSRKCVSWYYKAKNGKIDNQKLHESSDYSEQKSNEESSKEGESYYHSRHNTEFNCSTVLVTAETVFKVILK